MRLEGLVWAAYEPVIDRYTLTPCHEPIGRGDGESAWLLDAATGAREVEALTPLLGGGSESRRPAVAANDHADKGGALAQQLPAAERHSVLLALASAAQTRWAVRTAQAEERLRALAAAARGLRWDDRDEDAREQFVDALLHDDR